MIAAALNVPPLERLLGAACGVCLSAHAELARIGGAAELAARRGARKSLALSDPLALVVSVPNRTVITALETDGTVANVFTQIDGAVVLPFPATPPSPGLDPAGEAPIAADRPMRRNAKEMAS